MAENQIRLTFSISHTISKKSGICLGSIHHDLIESTFICKKTCTQFHCFQAISSIFFKCLISSKLCIVEEYFIISFICFD
ncbi:hypothetical protein HOF65_04090 [bacterium]|nr:hypothetical protein [bacterium]